MGEFKTGTSLWEQAFYKGVGSTGVLCRVSGGEGGVFFFSLCPVFQSRSYLGVAALCRFNQKWRD